MPPDNIRPDSHAFLSAQSISNSQEKANLEVPKAPKPPTSDERLLIITAVIVALSGVILGLITRQYMMLVAANAPLIAAIQITQRRRQ